MSVQSQSGVVCPGEQARVRPRPVLPPQGRGGQDSTPDSNLSNPT